MLPNSEIVDLSLEYFPRGLISINNINYNFNQLSGSVEELNLSNNQISNQSFLTLLGFISQQIKQGVDVSYLIFDGLRLLINLKKLHLNIRSLINSYSFYQNSFGNDQHSSFDTFQLQNEDYVFSYFMKHSFSALTQLEHLDLQIEFKDLDIQVSDCFFDSLQNLTQLKYLSLKLNYCSAFNANQGVNCLGSCLMNMKLLKILIIQYGQRCKENDIQISQLCNGIKELLHLEQLELMLEEGNKIDIQGLASLGDCFTNLINITRLTIQLSVDSQKDQTFVIAKLFKGLQSLSNLQDLSLYFTKEVKIEIQSIECLSEVLSKLENIQTLNIQFAEDNDLTQDVSQKLGESIQNMKQLTSLSIRVGRKNYIGTGLMTGLHNSFERIAQNLIQLRLDAVYQKDNGIEQLQFCLYNQRKSLQKFHLRLSENFYLNFAHMQQESNFSQFTMESLTHLILEFSPPNFISGKQQNTLQNSFVAQLFSPALKILELKNENILNNQMIAHYIVKLSNLETLKITCNDSDMILVQAISKLTNINYLHLIILDSKLDQFFSETFYESLRLLIKLKYLSFETKNCSQTQISQKCFMAFFDKANLKLYKLEFLQEKLKETINQSMLTLVYRKQTKLVVFP